MRESLFFYIDPGTGSMLFTILIGILGAGIYAFRNVIVKVKFLFSGGNAKVADEERVPFAIFTDSRRYKNIFKPICDEMEQRGEKVLYLTAEDNDPMLEENYQHIETKYIGPGNRAFATMNMLKADIVLTSTPGLDVYQWKRSRDVLWYVHVNHAPSDVTMYRMFGIDYFDAMLLNGKFQVKQVRDLEALRKLPAKELKLVGLPYLDTLRERLLNAEKIKNQERVVLIAPSWGPNAIFQRYGSKIIDALLKTPWHIIIRPHPQSFVSEAEIIEPLMVKYPNSDRLEWDRSVDNFDVMNRSDILISDFSGIIFDYIMVFDKPVIYADVEYDNGMLDAWWLKDREWTFDILEKVGLQLTKENLSEIESLVNRCLTESRFKEGRDQAREEAWENVGHSSEAIADYLISRHAELIDQK